ncbi:hypothetical protein OCU04_012088 [Sclerotinia nivalis]|uniref:Uncharacterized protein n=1 Tax=Sclerotinia nivalis TaxID=352851 RepID=A0A9X0AAF7_9HELO|nr:hypothetical protein OCU04_012088 [Sclerotinia nivalis]
MQLSSGAIFAITGACFVLLAAVFLYCTFREPRNNRNNSIINLQELGQLPRRPRPVHSRHPRRSHSTHTRHPRHSRSAHTRHPRHSHSTQTRRPRLASDSSEERIK